MFGGRSDNLGSAAEISAMRDPTVPLRLKTDMLTDPDSAEREHSGSAVAERASWCGSLAAVQLPVAACYPVESASGSACWAVLSRSVASPSGSLARPGYFGCIVV
jgi:hypothetical protein